MIISAHRKLQSADETRLDLEIDKWRKKTQLVNNGSFLVNMADHFPKRLPLSYPLLDYYYYYYYYYQMIKMTKLMEMESVDGNSLRSTLWILIETFYELGRTIGRGEFAKVKLARCRVTQQLVAIKIIRIDDARGDRLDFKKSQSLLYKSIPFRFVVSLTVAVIEIVSSKYYQIIEGITVAGPHHYGHGVR